MYEEYLLSFRENCKHLHKIKFLIKIKVDVILIKHPLKPRLYWQLGRVVKLFPRDDDKIRSFRVKRDDGLTQRYSIKHLYPLGLSLTHDYHPLMSELEKIKKDNYQNTITNVPVTKGRSTTKASHSWISLCPKRTANLKNKKDTPTLHTYIIKCKKHSKKRKKKKGKKKQIRNNLRKNNFQIQSLPDLVRKAIF